MAREYTTGVSERTVRGAVRSSIMQHIMQNGTFMVPEIASATGFSLTTVAKYVSERNGPTESPRPRRPHLLFPCILAYWGLLRLMFSACLLGLSAPRSGHNGAGGYGIPSRCASPGRVQAGFSPYRPAYRRREGFARNPAGPAYCHAGCFVHVRIAKYLHSCVFWPCSRRCDSRSERAHSAYGVVLPRRAMSRYGTAALTPHRRVKSLLSGWQIGASRPEECQAACTK